MANANQFTTKFETVSGAQAPFILNTPVATAETEVPIALTGNVKQLLLRCREQANLQIAFVATESATKYFTIKKGTVLSLDDLNFNSPTIYIQSDKGSVTIETLYWT